MEFSLSMFIWDLIPGLFFLIASIMGFRLVRRLYGGRFTSALPYLLIGIFLILGMQVIHLVLEPFSPVLEESMYFMFALNGLQIIAGVFFVLALYQIYQSRYATEGFMNIDFEKNKKKSGGKKQ